MCNALYRQGKDIDIPCALHITCIGQGKHGYMCIARASTRARTGTCHMHCMCIGQRKGQGQVHCTCIAHPLLVHESGQQADLFLLLLISLILLILQFRNSNILSVTLIANFFLRMLPRGERIVQASQETLI